MGLHDGGHSVALPSPRRVSLPLSAGLQGAMANFMSHIAVPIAIGAVAIVLLLGLANMMMGGSGNTSQKLMRLRVLLQFAIAIGRDHARRS